MVPIKVKFLIISGTIVHYKLNLQSPTLPFREIDKTTNDNSIDTVATQTPSARPKTLRYRDHQVPGCAQQFFPCLWSFSVLTERTGPAADVLVFRCANHSASPIPACSDRASALVSGGEE